MWPPFARVKATLLKGICGVFFPAFGSFPPVVSEGEETEGAGVGVDVGGCELFRYWFDWFDTGGGEVSFRLTLLAAIASSMR